MLTSDRMHFEEVVRSEEFLQLEVTQLLELVGADDLCTQSEEQVYEAVMAWVKHDPVNREKYLAELLEKASAVANRAYDKQ